MSENLKRAESLFNRIMNNGKEATPFKPSIKHKSDKDRDSNNGYHGHSHHNNGQHNHNGHHSHNGHNGHNNHNRNKHRNELLNHEALKLPEQILTEVVGVENQHVLPYCWTIWHHSRYASKKRTSIDDKNKYLSMTREVEFPKYGDITVTTKHLATIEQMWLDFSILGQPKDVPIGTEYLIFKSGINPAWEDPFNTKGGRWIFKFHRKAGEGDSPQAAVDEQSVRERTSLIWERLTLRILTGSFISLEENNEELVKLLLNDINGIVLSIRKEEDIISIWNSNLNTKNKKLSNVPTRRILCDSILRVIRECDLIAAGEDIVDTTSTSETSNERVKNVSFEYRLHSDYNTNRRFNHHSNPHSSSSDEKREKDDPNDQPSHI